MSKPYLSVIIPSYNELKNIRQNVLDEVYDYLKKQPYTWEIVCSDDGSTDGTVEQLHQFAKRDPSKIRVLENLHRGKAPTIYSGMMSATGENRLFTDFDQATPLEEVELLFPYVKDGYDIVFGSREIAGSKREKEPFYRHLMGKVWNIFVQTLAVPGISDTQCGFKLFTEKAAITLFPAMVIYKPSENERTTAFTGAFDVELLYIARKYGFTYKEVPVQWHHVQTNRVNPIRDSLIMLFDLVKIRTADILGKYKRV